MKKLLLVGVLLALGTTALANPATGATTSANVEVRAEIVDDHFIISDIYGKPIVVDFGKIYNDQKQSAVTFVDYKVTAKEAAVDNRITFDILLGEQTSANNPTPVIISTNLGGNNDSMKANLVLSEYKGEILVGETEYRGRINGTLAKEEFDGKNVGVYTGNTQLKVIVK